LRRQGFVNAYAGIALPNPASVRLHEVLGMKLIGVYEKVGFKFGEWLDVAWYGMELAEPAADPREPVPFSALA
jgi:phosphinothricin acetyltransferase